MDIDIKRVLAMAVACVCEEKGIDQRRIIVRSFQEIQKSSLQKYIEDHHISYHKYQLEDSGS